MNDPRWRLASLAAAVFLACLPPIQAMDVEKKTNPDPAPRDGRKPTPAEKRLQLPEAGKRRASELFELLEKLSGDPVVPLNPAILEIPIRITAEAAGQWSTAADVMVILGAHGIFLLPVRNPDSSRAWVASRDRLTREDELPRFTRTFELSPSRFNRAVEAVDRFLAGWNKEQPKDGPTALSLPIRSTGKIIVRSPSEKIFDSIQKAIDKVDQEEALNPDEKHLFTYEVRNRRAEELEEVLLARLSELEAKRVTVIVPRGRNFLLVRTFPDLWEKAQKILQSVDVPQKSRTRVDGPRSGKVK